MHWVLLQSQLHELSASGISELSTSAFYPQVDLHTLVITWVSTQYGAAEIAKVTVQTDIREVTSTYMSLAGIKLF